MRNIEDLAAEEEALVWESRRKFAGTMLVAAATGSGLWGWWTFYAGRMNQGSFYIILSLVLFSVSWGSLRLLPTSFPGFFFGATAGGCALVLYSFTHLPAFYWGKDPSFWLAVHGGVVPEPCWSPLSYLLDQTAIFVSPKSEYSILPEISAIVLSLALFFIVHDYFLSLRNKTILNACFVLGVGFILVFSIPFWNAGTMASGLPSALGLLIFIFQKKLLEMEERPGKLLYFLMGLFWTVHPTWGLIGTINHWVHLGREGSGSPKKILALLLGLSPYLWILFRANRTFSSWGGVSPFIEALHQTRSLWLVHRQQDWDLYSALQNFGWIGLLLGLFTLLGWLLNALDWKTGWKIQYSTREFWVWLSAGMGGVVFFSLTTENLGPTILLFFWGLGGMWILLLEKGFEKRQLAFFSGRRFAWIAAAGLLFALICTGLPGQSRFRNQFYFPQQHALNLLQGLGTKSLLICQDSFDAEACLEERILEPTALDSYILEQRYMDQRWYVSQLMEKESNVLFSVLDSPSQVVLKRFILENQENWSIQLDVPVSPAGLLDLHPIPTVLTQLFNGKGCGILDPVTVQYRYDLAAITGMALPEVDPARGYFDRYVLGFDELGKYLLAQARYSESIHAFERSEKLDPDFADPRIQLAAMYSKSNILEAARLEFENTIKNNPAKISVIMGDMEKAQKTKDEMKTINCLDSMIKLNSELANAQYQLSKIYNQEGRREEAKTLLEASVQLNPRQMEAQMTLGHLMARMGNKLKAIEAFQEVLMIDPQNKESQVELWKLFNKP